MTVAEMKIVNRLQGLAKLLHPRDCAAVDRWLRAAQFRRFARAGRAS